MDPIAHQRREMARIPGVASHAYRLTGGELRRLALTLAAGIGLTLSAMPLARVGWLTPDVAARNPDEAGFEWKRRAASRPGDSSVVISGDSSCTTGVDPLVVERASEPQISCLNLGLIIDLPLWTYADALQRAVTASNGRVKFVIVLVSPQRLGHIVTGPYFESLWLSRPEPVADGKSFHEYFEQCTGLWRASLPFRLVERPLRGEGRGLYGFPSGVTRFTDEHRGAFVDSGAYRFRHREQPEVFEPTDAIRAEAIRFRSTWRRQVPLVVGIAPIPYSYAPADYAVQRQRLLGWFREALGGDAALDTLPGTLQDGLFASPTHLNSRGQDVFSTRMARELSRLLAAP